MTELLRQYKRRAHVGCKPVFHKVCRIHTFATQHYAIRGQTKSKSSTDPMTLHGGDNRNFAIERYAIYVSVCKFGLASVKTEKSLLRTAGAKVSVVTR